MNKMGQYYLTLKMESTIQSLTLRQAALARNILLLGPELAISIIFPPTVFVICNMQFPLLHSMVKDISSNVQLISQPLAEPPSI